MRLNVAGVQVRSEFGKPQRNLRNAASYVRKAASAGAQLILCPEFLASGYKLETALWAFAEPRGGVTESWLLRQAKLHRVFIGASYLERQSGDYFNCFALASPDGEILGRVRKRNFAYFESWLFSAGSGSRVIPSQLGRIGVGICFDAYTEDFLQEMAREQVDFLLMPHSAALIPRFPGISESIQDSLCRVAPCCSLALGIPSLLVNQAGTGTFSTSLPIFPAVRVKMEFPGRSMLCSAAGEIVVQLDGRESIACGEISLDPGFRVAERKPGADFWSARPRSFPRALAVVHRLLTQVGRRRYRKRLHHP